MKLYLLTGGAQEIRIDIAKVSTQEEASQIVAKYDRLFEEWEKNGFPPHPFPVVLAYWEGCDIYLEANDGRQWLTTNFGWQECHTLQKEGPSVHHGDTKKLRDL
jgi:hypothetical protein